MTATTVRYTLKGPVTCAPGHSVETWIPPFSATQAAAGTVHRQDIPPNVVRADVVTWLVLATGRPTWQDALADGVLHTSGERCDLSAYLPLIRLPG